MKYRIAEISKEEFIIQCEVREYDLYWWFGWKEKNIRMVWCRLDIFGHPKRSSLNMRFAIHMSSMKSFKTLKKAKDKIKELQTETKFHYIEEHKRPTTN